MVTNFVKVLYTLLKKVLKTAVTMAVPAVLGPAGALVAGTSALRGGEIGRLVANSEEDKKVWNTIGEIGRDLVKGEVIGETIGKAIEVVTSAAGSAAGAALAGGTTEAGREAGKEIGKTIGKVAFEAAEIGYDVNTHRKHIEKGISYQNGCPVCDA